MISSKGRDLKHASEQTINAYRQLDKLIQQNNHCKEVIKNRSGINQDHDENGKQIEKTSRQQMSSKDLLKLINIRLEDYQTWTDGLIQLRRWDIPGLERTIDLCKTAVQDLKEARLRFEKIIELQEFVDRKRILIAKEKAEKLAQQAQKMQEVINLQEQLHSLQGKYRVFCKIMPTAQNVPKSKVIQRLNYFQINILEKITHYANGVSKKMVKHDVDYAFQESVKQKEVYRQMLYLLRSAFEGQTCSIMSYGQSGSGKSYTLIGPKGCLQSQTIQQNSGLIPRILEQALAMRDQQRQKGKQIAITLQFFEKGYTPKVVNSGFLSVAKNPKSPEKKANNKSRPNQSSPKQNISVKKSNSRQQYFIKDLKFALQLLKAHIDNRKVAATPLNPDSSRSHLCIILRVKHHSSQKKKDGMLSLIDLAGHSPSKFKTKNEQQQQEYEQQEKPNPKQSKSQNKLNMTNKNSKLQNKFQRTNSKQPKQQQEQVLNPETSYINNSLNQVAKVIRLIRNNTAVVWPSFPYLMRYLQPYLEGSKGIVIVTLSSKKSGEQANRTSMKFIKDIQ